MGKQRLTKNQKRRLKKKEKQKQNSTKGSGNDNTNRTNSVNNKTNARGNRLATNGARNVDDEYVTEEMDRASQAFSDGQNQSLNEGKEKDTIMDEVDSGTNEKGANGAFDGAEGVGKT